MVKIKETQGLKHRTAKGMLMKKTLRDRNAIMTKPNHFLTTSLVIMRQVTFLPGTGDPLGPRRGG